MTHSREEVINRTIQEFKLLDSLVANLSDEDWARPVPRPETKDPWTVKDTLAHITFWKSSAARLARKEHRPPEERGLQLNELNHLIYTRWRDRSPQEVLAWHRQVQEDALEAMKNAPEAYFTRRDRGPDWPGDLDGHSAFHRMKDIEQALSAGKSR